MLTLIFFIAFPFLLWKAWQTHKVAKGSVAWPTTPGTITKVERFKRLFRALPRVGYSYAVDGTTFNSERISFAAGYRPKEVDAVLSRYAPGQSVPVYYTPAKPQEAVLEPGSNKQVTAPIRMLIICFVLLLLLNALQFYLRSVEGRDVLPRTYDSGARP